MNPNSTKYYVSNYLSHTTSVIDMTTNPPTKIKDIPLLDPSPNGNYSVVDGPNGKPI